FPGQALPRLVRTARHRRRAARDPHHLLLWPQGEHGRPPQRRRRCHHRGRTGLDREVGLCFPLPPALGRRNRPLAGERTASMTDSPAAEPHGPSPIRTLARPADTNPAGDIFGGWVMSQMDIAGAIAAVERVKGRVVTVAVEAMTFISPVKVGDILCVYCTIERVGNTSITIAIEAWARCNRVAD